MKHIPSLFLILLSFFFIFSQPVLAVKFSSASVRLDRTSSSTALSGLVCATPSSAGAGTEGKIAITFPSDFSLSTNLANWTTGTTNLPSDGTIWPGIGSTAQSVSGQTVTFASSDLTSTQKYCFTFSASSSTTGSAGDQTGTLTSKNSTNTQIDQTDIGFTIGADNITVSATVPASALDFTTTTTSQTSGSTFPQDTAIDYQITYGSNLSTVSSFTLEAQWSQGTISGSANPSVDLLDYTIGSATTAYGNTAPVIDLANRKITWTISSFPANTSDKTVTFQLRTNSAYTGSNGVTFNVSSRIIGPGNVSSVDSTVSQTYQYSQTITPTPTTGSGPTNTPTPGPTATPTPVTSVPNLLFQDVALRSLRNTSAKIAATTNLAGTMTIQYGPSIRSLTQTLTDLSSSKEHLFALTELDPQTTYYFQLSAHGPNNQQKRSDIFIFRTAKGENAPEISDNSLVIISNNVIVHDAITGGKKENIIVLPTSTLFQIKLGMQRPDEIKTIQLFIQNKKVLGTNTFTQQADAASFNTNMIAIENNEFLGRLITDNAPGFYQLFARVTDTNGNLLEEKIIDIHVSPFFTVYGKKNIPVEGAQVILYFYNKNTRLFTPISSQGIAIKNPNFTDYDGALRVTLPQGTYKAEVSALGYKNKSITFTIGNGEKEVYPQLMLEKEPFSPVTLFHSIIRVFNDLFFASAITLQELSKSYRILRSVNDWILTIFVLLTFFAFKQRTHFHFRSILIFLHYHLNRLLRRLPVSTHVVGTIVDDATKQPLTKAVVSILSAADATVLTNGVTNKQGQFFCSTSANEFRLQIMKEGYHPVITDIMHKDDVTINIVVSITQTKAAHPRLNTLRSAISIFCGLCFEVLLFLSLIMELFIVNRWGGIETILCLLASLANLTIWIFLQKTATLNAYEASEQQNPKS